MPAPLLCAIIRLCAAVQALAEIPPTNHPRRHTVGKYLKCRRAVILPHGGKTVDGFLMTDCSTEHTFDETMVNKGFHIAVKAFCVALLVKPVQLAPLHGNQFSGISFMR